MKPKIIIVLTLVLVAIVAVTMVLTSQVDVVEKLSLDAPLKSSNTANKTSTHRVNMTARKWAFTPNVITARVGDTIEITVRGLDVRHGFVIDEYDIQKELIPKTDTTFAFIADKAGVFDYYSNIDSGPGTSTMRGQLIVK